MISYAQNFEDVLLERCFKDVAQGFYVDVGAGHPIRDSVTYWFYRRGWNGLNIEPAAAAFRMLDRYRPRDINVHAFVGSRFSEVDFFDGGLSGLSTDSPRLAEKASSRGYASRRVPMRAVTLSALCSKHNVERIDFLKVDAEGSEPKVLSGFDLSRWRPKVIVVEAIDPVTAAYSNQESANLLLSSGYSRCFFDGLNDYFLAVEASDLAKHFTTPANVLDNAEKWFDHIVDGSRASLDGLAWRRIFDLRLRSQWAEMTQDEEIERECRELSLDDPTRRPTVEDVRRLYADLLGRVPDAEEAKQWVILASTRPFTVRDLVQSIVQSEEYCRKSLEWGGL